MYQPTDKMAGRFSPLVSVVVPCRNEKDHIEKCVRSILAQEEVAGGFEVIVIDGDSDDGTRAVLDRLGEEDGRVRVLRNRRRIVSSAFNLGIRAARGRYIALMGAHNHYASDYLRESVAALERTGADNVGGAMICEGKSWFQKAAAAAHHSRFSAGGARWHNFEYEGPADTVFGGVYRREVFDRIGLFDEDLVRNQDDEFNLRLRRAGGKIWQSPRIRSWYCPRDSLRALFQQYLQYGYWKVRVIQKHRLPASIRHLIPGAFVFAILALPPAAVFLPLAAWLWLGLLGAYAAANISASFITSARRGWKLLSLLPFVFASYHFGYGLGFLFGLLNVVLRREAAPLFTKLSRSSTH
jgi:glycosyltransferase involved in cell wall biosynthesis